MVSAVHYGVAQLTGAARAEGRAITLADGGRVRRTRGAWGGASREGLARASGRPAASPAGRSRPRRDLSERRTHSSLSSRAAGALEARAGRLPLGGADRFKMPTLMERLRRGSPDAVAYKTVKVRGGSHRARVSPRVPNPPPVATDAMSSSTSTSPARLLPPSFPRSSSKRTIRPSSPCTSSS